MQRLVFRRYSLATPTKYVSRHREILEEYFKQAKFQLKPENHQQNIETLKHAMDIVYMREVPLVSFDVEAYERSLLKVTEIGFSIYDPELLKNSIFPAIKSGHIIIKEHLKLNNYKFVPNHKRLYLGGISYVASIEELKKIMQSIFDEYITKRSGAFVGHNIGGDIRWLQQMNVDISNDVKTVDTFKLHALSRKRDGTLRGVLRYLDIPHSYLHNAGNDSYFTLLAAFALCDPELRALKNMDTFQDNKGIDKKDAKKHKFSDQPEITEYLGKGIGFFDE